MNIENLFRHFSNKKINDKIKDLDEQIESLKAQKITKQSIKKYNLTNAEIILIAHYSGLLEDSDTDNLSKAKELQEKFGTSGFENLRKKLSNIQSLKTVNRLKRVCKYFEEKGNENFLKLALKDLKNAENKTSK